MGSDYGSGNMSLRLRSEREGGQRSIIKALNSFVKAVNVMDQTVMIPSRLRDMEVTVNIKPDGQMIPVENNNELAILPAGGAKNANLYGCYTMLHAIKHELISGGTLDGSTDDGAPEGGVNGGLGEADSQDSDTDGRPTAAAFRYHLTSLLGASRQATSLVWVGRKSSDSMAGSWDVYFSGPYSMTAQYINRNNAIGCLTFK